MSGSVPGTADVSFTPAGRRGTFPTGTTVLEAARALGVDLGYTGRRPFPAGRRLGCAAQILDDVVIDVPESSQVHRQVVRKDAGRLEVPVDPVIALHYIEVDEPTMVDAIGD